MKRSISIRWGELRVGLLIMFAFAAILYASFSGSGTSILESKIKFRSYFANVNGLVKGSPVWISGVEVGNVQTIDIVNYGPESQIEVRFRVKKAVHDMITEDAVIKIGTIGFIGDKYLEIIPGTTGKPNIQDEGIIPSITPGDLNAIFAKGEKAMVVTNELAKNLNELTNRMNNGEGTLGQLATNDTLYVTMTHTLARLTDLFDKLQTSQARIVASIDNVSTELDQLLARANRNESTIGRLFAEPALYDNLESSTGQIDSILAKINAGQGTVGAVVNDEQLYTDVRNLVVRIDNLVTDIESNPRKYFKFSIF